MFTYQVRSKASGDLAYVYDAEAPIEWNEFPFAQYDHVETPYVDPEAPPAPTPIGVKLTKLEFLTRFTQAERVTMRTIAESNGEMRDYMHMLDIAEEVFTDDPRTVAGVNALEAAGIIGAGRAQEILNG